MFFGTVKVRVGGAEHCSSTSPLTPATHKDILVDEFDSSKTSVTFGSTVPNTSTSFLIQFKLKSNILKKGYIITLYLPGFTGATKANNLQIENGSDALKFDPQNSSWNKEKQEMKLAFDSDEAENKSISVTIAQSNGIMTPATGTDNTTTQIKLGLYGENTSGSLTVIPKKITFNNIAPSGTFSSLSIRYTNPTNVTPIVLKYTYSHDLNPGDSITLNVNNFTRTPNSSINNLALSSTDYTGSWDHVSEKIVLTVKAGKQFVKNMEHTVTIMESNGLSTPPSGLSKTDVRVNVTGSTSRSVPPDLVINDSQAVVIHTVSNASIAFTPSEAQKVPEMIVTFTSSKDLIAGDVIVLTLPGCTGLVSEDIPSTGNIGAKWTSSGSKITLTLNNGASFIKNTAHSIKLTPTHLTLPNKRIPACSSEACEFKLSITSTLDLSKSGGTYSDKSLSNSEIKIIGEFINNLPELSYGNKNAGEESSITLTFQYSKSISKDDVITVNLPGFSETETTTRTISSGQYFFFEIFFQNTFSSSWSSGVLTLTALQQIVSEKNLSFDIAESNVIKLPNKVLNKNDPNFTISIYGATSTRSPKVLLTPEVKAGLLTNTSLAFATKGKSTGKPLEFAVGTLKFTYNEWKADDYIELLLPGFTGQSTTNIKFGGPDASLFNDAKSSWNLSKTALKLVFKTGVTSVTSVEVTFDDVTLSGVGFVKLPKNGLKGTAEDKLSIKMFSSTNASTRHTFVAPNIPVVEPQGSFVSTLVAFNPAEAEEVAEVTFTFSYDTALLENDIVIIKLDGCSSQQSDLNITKSTGATFKKATWSAGKSEVQLEVSASGVAKNTSVSVTIGGITMPTSGYVQDDSKVMAGVEGKSYSKLANASSDIVKVYGKFLTSTMEYSPQTANENTEISLSFTFSEKVHKTQDVTLTLPGFKKSGDITISTNTFGSSSWDNVSNLLTMYVKTEVPAQSPVVVKINGFKLPANGLQQNDSSLFIEANGLSESKKTKIKSSNAVNPASVKLIALGLKGTPTPSLSPSFSPAVRSYTATVPFSMTTTTLEVQCGPEEFAPFTTKLCKGDVMLCSSASADVFTGSSVLTLTPGVNDFVVYASSNSKPDVTALYNISITRSQPSSDATLKSLGFPNGYTSVPNLNATGRTYEMDAKLLYTVALTPVANDSKATIKIEFTSEKNGTKDSGAPPQTIPMLTAKSEGKNVVNIVVTAEDGVTKETYLINISRDDVACKVKSCDEGRECDKITGSCRCKNDCTNSKQGTCSAETGKCECKSGWGSDDCSTVACPSDKDLGECSGHGKCDEGTVKCICTSGWGMPSTSTADVPSNGDNKDDSNKVVVSNDGQPNTCSTRICENNCNKGGECVADTAKGGDAVKCECYERFTGDACEIFDDTVLVPQGNAATIDVAYGIKGVDRNKVDSTYLVGTPIFDESFDLKLPKIQQHILDGCITAYNSSGQFETGLSPDAEKKLTLGNILTTKKTKLVEKTTVIGNATSGLLIRTSRLWCPMMDFAIYATSTSRNWGFPVTGHCTDPLLHSKETCLGTNSGNNTGTDGNDGKRRRKLAGDAPTLENDDKKDDTPVAVQWLEGHCLSGSLVLDTYTTKETCEASTTRTWASEFDYKFNKFIRNDSTGSAYVQGGYIGDGQGYPYTRGSKIKFLKTRYMINLVDNAPLKIAMPIYERWNEYIKKHNEGVSEATAVQTSKLWMSVMMESEAVRGAVEAWVISNGAAFIAILFFTGNIFVAFYCTVAIMGIVVLLAAFMVVYMEWEFGAIEAISITIFVGFSVDYCLHLAHAYNDSPHRDKFLRTRDALTMTGVSVFSAAVTTMGSALMLLFCKIQVFVKMGLLVGMNTFLAIYFALIFFAALLMAAGPSGACGTWRCCCPKKDKWANAKGRDKYGNLKQVEMKSMSKEEEAKMAESGEKPDDSIHVLIDRIVVEEGEDNDAVITDRNMDGNISPIESKDSTNEKSESQSRLAALARVASLERADNAQDVAAALPVQQNGTTGQGSDLTKKESETFENPFFFEEIPKKHKKKKKKRKSQ